jgi:hypothetical protein
MADYQDPARSFKTITPHDTDGVAAGCRALWIGGEGDISVTDKSGEVTVFTAVPAGTMLPISPKLIMATGTTATPIIALY